MTELFFYALIILLVSPIIVMGGIIIGGLALGINQLLNIRAIPAVLISLAIIYLFVR